MRKHSQEISFLEPAFIEFGNSEFLFVALEKKSQFSKRFFKILYIQNFFSFLKTSRKVSPVEFLVQQQGLNCSHAILLKGNPITYVFLNIFQSFQCSYFKTSLCEKCPNTQIFLVRIQSEYRKIRARKNSISGHFSRSSTLIVLGY